MRSQIRRIACVGGGPGGLFFAALARLADPELEITVFERNRHDDTFGFGVVFSSSALRAICAAEPVLGSRLREHSVHWDEIEVRLKGSRIRCGGNGMSAIRRHTLLSLLQARAAEVGVTLRFACEIERAGDLNGYDVVVAADGANSRLRSEHAACVQPTVQTAAAKFIWFGTTRPFDGLTFIHAAGPDGVFAAHCYPIGDGLSTFIVETDEETWQRAGLDGFDTSQPSGVSDLDSKRYLEASFAEHLDGHGLLTNNSRWGNFRTWRSQRWRAGTVVLLGDAAHTAHFSVGSGTRMALEDAIVLARQITEHRGDLDTALAAYEAERRPAVERIQGSARPSLSWWERFGRYHHALDPWQFAFHFLTRSISVDKLRLRDRDYVAGVEDQWRHVHAAPPLDTPLDVAGLRFATRKVTIERGPSGMAARAFGDGHEPILRLYTPGAVSQRHTRWGLLLPSPPAEEGLQQALATVDHTMDGASTGVAHQSAPALVAIAGGSPLTRVLLSEEVRLTRGIPTMVVDETFEAERAVTLLLSGRTDLVGVCATSTSDAGA